MPASANPPRPVGGLNLDGYCNSLGYSGGATLIRRAVTGPNYAYDNWRCLNSDGSTHPFSMEQACKFDQQTRAILAQPTDPNNAFFWTCFVPGNL